MIKLFTEEEFKKTRCIDLLPCKCQFCSKVFYKTKRKIMASIKHSSHSSMGSCCSHKCAHKYIQSLCNTTVNCKNCGKEFNKSNRSIKKSPSHFCSLSCNAKYQNAHKTTGCRISKLEVWLQQELTLLYPNMEFQFNRRDTILSELDIYIPSLRLAFEINGIFHYEPIYGGEHFSKIINNDKMKLTACHEKGIGLFIIDHSKEGCFKIERSKKYLKIITDIINQNLSLEINQVYS